MVSRADNSKDVIKKLSKQIDVLKAERTKHKQELKREQKKLRETQRLATLGNLASAVAHELRNPMGVIRLATYSLHKKIDSKDKNLHKHLDNIDKKIIEADQIIHDLLAFSRASELEFRKVDLNKCLLEGLEANKGCIEECGIKVKKNLDNRTPEMVGGFTQLMEAFYNLFLNAVQAMKESKEKELKVATQYKHNGIEIKISDTGCGIVQQDFEKLGEPFFSTKTKGIGLGLYITYEIIRRHKGTIKVESARGEGTTFIITLPLKM